MIQNSAISFSICIYNKYNKLEPLLEALKTKFKLEVTDGVSFILFAILTNRLSILLKIRWAKF